MNHGGARPKRTRAAPGRLLPAAMLAATALLGACSSGETSATTSTTTTTTTAPPNTSAPPGEAQAGAEEPPAIEWIVQIGGPGSDSLSAVASRDDELVATGLTEGGLAGPGEGGGDVLVALVGTDAEVRTLEQSGSAGDETALAVASSEVGTLACGYTTGELAAPSSGGEDAWCAPVDQTGALGELHQQGGSESDRLLDVSLGAEATGYAGGYTLGLFPGASDTSAGQLGSGDALMWQVGPAGTPNWIRQFGTAAQDRGQGVATTGDGDGLLVGYTQGDLDGPSNGGSDAFVARFDPDGVPRFVRQFGTGGEDVANAVGTGGEATRGTETFVVAGNTDGAMAPALGGEVTDLSEAPRADGAEPLPNNAGGTDAMVVAVDPGGQDRWSAQIGSSGDDSATAVGIDGNTVLVAGTTAGVLDTTGAPAAGGTDGYLAALDLESGALRWVTQFGSEGDEQVDGLTITEDGLVVVAGTTSGSLGENVNAGGTDGFLVAFPLPSTGGSVASAL